MNINKYEKLCEQHELLYEQYKETKEKIKAYEILEGRKKGIDTMIRNIDSYFGIGELSMEFNKRGSCDAVTCVNFSVGEEEKILLKKFFIELREKNVQKMEEL
ncbi:hypothetical protein ACWJU0_18830 [Clostridioides difficile]|nr:hypothetical protein [Clostridioides difficile]HBG7232949.1 hypothetical protein [Clostridioides difficile]